MPVTEDSQLNDIEAEKKQEMVQWHSHRNFIMALICWTVGLGNCWRFPVAASLDGGGVFLLPYLLETFVIAIPLTYMELGLGQFANRGPVAVWALCPIWKVFLWYLLQIEFKTFF